MKFPHNRDELGFIYFVSPGQTRDLMAVVLQGAVALRGDFARAGEQVPEGDRDAFEAWFSLLQEANEVTQGAYFFQLGLADYDMAKRYQKELGLWREVLEEVTGERPSGTEPVEPDEETLSGVKSLGPLVKWGSLGALAALGWAVYRDIRR